MHTLIITDDAREALFIQKGIQLEDMPSLIMDFRNDEDIKNELIYCDGVFLNLKGDSEPGPLLRLCRTYKKDIPIVLLSSKTEKKLLEISILEDIPYFQRPFPLRNIASTMRMAIFMAKEDTYEEVYQLRDLHLNVNYHQVKHKDENIYLRNREFSLLHFLMVNKGKILSRNTILENVWDRNANMLTNTVEVHMSHLRKKIEKKYGTKYIHTIPCTGYMLN